MKKIRYANIIKIIETLLYQPIKFYCKNYARKPLSKKSDFATLF